AGEPSPEQPAEEARLAGEMRRRLERARRRSALRFGAALAAPVAAVALVAAIAQAVNVRDASRALLSPAAYAAIAPGDARSEAEALLPAGRRVPLLRGHRRPAGRRLRRLLPDLLHRGPGLLHGPPGELGALTTPEEAGVAAPSARAEGAATPRSSPRGPAPSALRRGPAGPRRGTRPAEVGEDDLDPAVAGGVRPEVRLGEDRVDVLGDRAAAQHRLGGDAGVGAAGGDQPEDLAFARGQPGEQRGGAGPRAGRGGRAAGRPAGAGD